MADSDKNLNIGINLHTTKSGGDPAQEIKNVTTATKDLEQTVAKGNKSKEESTQKTLGLKRAMNLLTQQFGDFGRIAGLAASLPAFAIAALAIGINKATAAYQNYQKAILEKAETINAMWAARQQAQQAAHDVMVTYNTMLGEVSKSTDTLATKETAQLATLNEVIKARNALLAAQEAAEIFAAGGDKKKEAEIKARYGEKSSQEDLDAEAAKLDLLKQNLEIARQLVHAAKAKAEAAAQEAAAFPESATGAEAAAKIKLTQEQESSKKLLEEELAAKNARVFRMTGTAGRTSAQLEAYLKAHPQEIREAENIPSATPEADILKYSEFARQTQRVREREQAVASNRKKISNAQATIKQVEDERARRGAAVEKTSADFKSKGEDFQARQRAVTTAEDVFNIHGLNKQDVTAAQQRGQYAKAGLGRVGNLLPGAASAARTAALGERPAPEDANDYNLLVSELRRGKKVQESKFIALLLEIHKDNVLTDAELDRVKAELWNVKRKVNRLPPNGF